VKPNSLAFKSRKIISLATSRRGVSLNEMLVVFAVVTLLLALLVPGLQRTREQMRRAQCMNNLRQWGIALQMYRDDNKDYLPTEGTYLGTGIKTSHTWYNALPPYLRLPNYKELERFKDQEGKDILVALPDLHTWICPAKNLTDAAKSSSGMNQFHYGMNQVLDGLGSADDPSPDTPGFPDKPDEPLPGRMFSRHPNTVFLFDIAPNSPAGTPRQVATELYKDQNGRRVARFHGDYANLLCLDGVVRNCRTADLVADNDMRHGAVRWRHPQLYWGYLPPE